MQLPATGNRNLYVDVTSDVSLSQTDISTHLHLIVQDGSTSAETTIDINEWIIDGDIVRTDDGAIDADISAPSWPSQLFGINLTASSSVTLVEIKWDE